MLTVVHVEACLFMLQCHGYVLSRCMCFQPWSLLPVRHLSKACADPCLCLLQHSTPPHPPTPRPRCLQVLAAYGDILNQLLTNTLHQSAAAQEQQGSVPDQLQRACFYLGLMPDDSWAPWALEFCYQCSDPLQRLRFLQGSEALQVYLELTGGWLPACMYASMRSIAPVPPAPGRMAAVQHGPGATSSTGRCWSCWQGMWQQPDATWCMYMTT
jgi:hypothetical protein